MDIAIAQNNNTGEVMLHKADCPVVRKMAEDGHPVMTMFGCDGPLPTEYEMHDCLKEK
jgi:hypothetical protein